MAETETETEAAPVPAAPAEKTVSDDDRRAQAAAVNRKRALDDWEAKKKLWRKMGVPAPLPAKK